MQKEIRLPTPNEQESEGSDRRGMICGTKETGGEVERVEKLLILRKYSLASSESLLLLTSLSSQLPPSSSLPPSSPSASSPLSFTPLPTLLSSLDQDPSLPSLVFTCGGKTAVCSRVVAVFMQARFELDQRNGVIGFVLRLYGDYQNIPPPVAFLIGKWLIHTKEKETATSFLASYLLSQPYSTQMFNLERVLCCDILRLSGIEEVENYLSYKQTIPNPEKEKILEICKTTPLPVQQEETETTETTELPPTEMAPTASANTTVISTGDKRMGRGKGRGKGEGWVGGWVGKWILEGLGKDGLGFVAPSSAFLFLFVVMFWIWRWLGRRTQGKGMGALIKNFLGVVMESFTFSGR